MRPTRLKTEMMSDCYTWSSMASESIEQMGMFAEIRAWSKVFEAVVWFPRLQALVNSTDSRGLLGTCRDISVMTWCCAGRCLIQLERDGARLTLITADDEKPWSRTDSHVAPFMGPMGIQGIDAEYTDALKLIHEVVRYGDQITLAPNDNVGIG